MSFFLFFFFRCLRFKCKGRITPLFLKWDKRPFDLFSEVIHSTSWFLFCPPQVRWNQDVVVNPKTRSTFSFSLQVVTAVRCLGKL